MGHVGKSNTGTLNHPAFSGIKKITVNSCLLCKMNEIGYI
jgi:hypothetical protein